MRNTKLCFSISLALLIMACDAGPTGGNDLTNGRDEGGDIYLMNCSALENALARYTPPNGDLSNMGDESVDSAANIRNRMIELDCGL